MLKICLNFFFFFFWRWKIEIYITNQIKAKSRLQGTQMCLGNNDYFGIFCYLVKEIMNHLYTLQNVSITRFKELTIIQKRTLRALKSIYLKFSLYTFFFPNQISKYPHSILYFLLHFTKILSISIYLYLKTEV